MSTIFLINRHVSCNHVFLVPNVMEYTSCLVYYCLLKVKRTGWWTGLWRRHANNRSYVASNEQVLV